MAWPMPREAPVMRMVWWGGVASIGWGRGRGMEGGWGLRVVCFCRVCNCFFLGEGGGFGCSVG